MYGFVMRSSKKFTQTTTFLCLYNALVRSQLEYAVPIWNPFYNKYIDGLEIVQKKFLRAMHYRCFHSFPSYEQLLQKYKLLRLEERRKQLEAMMLYDICHNRYDCIPIVDRLSYNVPTRTHCRSLCKLFAATRCRTNAGW
jgi:hypothetical protein